MLGAGKVHFLAMHHLRRGSQEFLHTAPGSNLGLNTNKQEKGASQLSGRKDQGRNGWLCGLMGTNSPPTPHITLPSGGNTKSGALGHGEMLSLDESSFPALELNNRRLSVKNSFCRKNGLYTRYYPCMCDRGLEYLTAASSRDGWEGAWNMPCPRGLPLPWEIASTLQSWQWSAEGHVGPQRDT